MKGAFFAACSVSIGLLLLLPASVLSQSTAESYQLKVHVNYSGAGTVDEKHKIYVVLWDSADFATGNASSMPVDIQSISSKDGTVTFNNVKKTPAYVSTVYDASGTWDAQSPPPDGSALGMYTKTPPQPAAIELKTGSPVSIDVRFDDSVKMQNGKPSR